MAYFSNGTEGMIFEEKYCEHCYHFNPDDGGCPIMAAHILYSYELCNKKDDPGKIILDMLIPQEGFYPGKCKMFCDVRRENKCPKEQKSLF